jgi:hypothetical protein
MVNLVFVFHRSFNDRETLEQALFGWAEACLHPGSPQAEPQEEDGLFAREEWLDISGCCLCRVEGDVLRVIELWENPRAYISIPPPVRSALSRGAVRSP